MRVERAFAVTPDTRLLRVPLPGRLIDRIDELVERGRGGYFDRDRLLRDAIEAYVLELEYASQGTDQPRAIQQTGSMSEPRDGDTSLLALRGPKPQARLVDESAIAHDDGLLFGLHNRDFPSLWAAEVFAELTAQSPVPFFDAADSVVARAWTLSEHLRELDETHPGKPSALFPTNRAKPQSAENAFRTHGIGNIVRTEGGLRAVGPLFAWSVLAIEESNNGLLVGVTPQGQALLEQLSGLNVLQPHSEHEAIVFFDHLARYAPSDLAGLCAITETVCEHPNRQQLLQSMSTRWSELAQSELQTNVAGYVARSREWGLVAQRQVDGHYLETDLSRTIVERFKG